MNRDDIEAAQGSTLAALDRARRMTRITLVVCLLALATSTATLVARFAGWGCTP